LVVVRGLDGVDGPRTGGAQQQRAQEDPWIRPVLKRKPRMVVAVALANKAGPGESRGGAHRLGGDGGRNRRPAHPAAAA
jgi:hypothetical protein